MASHAASAAALPVYRHAIANIFTTGALMVGVALLLLLMLPEQQ
jgi:hypothetical protein